MATGIDVVFTGLMMICLDGQPNCPVKGDYRNTAWVVKADGESAPCGWKDTARTTLYLKFNGKDDFSYSGDSGWIKDNCTLGDLAKAFCKIKDDEATVCINPYPATPLEDRRVDPSIQSVLRLDEVDRRFKAIRKGVLEDPAYVPTTIRFPTGVIGAGDIWPKGKAPILWFRSNGNAGGALPRPLSDRVKLAYDKAMKLTISDCGKTLIELTAKVNKAQVTLGNFADTLSSYEGRFEDLAYLLWYYPLGSWDTIYQSCPEYSDGVKDAVLLRCVKEGAKYCSGTGPADTRFWPPVLRPGLESP